MLKLAEQRKTEKKRLLKELATQLEGKGISVTLNEETSPVSLAADQVNPVLELKGRKINSISVMAVPSDSCGEMTNFYRFIHRITLDRGLARGTAKQIPARFNPKSLFGRITGNGNGTRWHGRELAEKLNTDSALSEIITNSPHQGEYQNAEIYVRDNTTVEIAGPWFRELAAFTGQPENALQQAEDAATYNIDMYEKIAGHIRDLVKTSDMPETVKTV